MLSQLNLVTTDNYIHFLLKSVLISCAFVPVSNVSRAFSFFRLIFFCEFVIFPKGFVGLHHSIFYLFLLYIVT